MKEISEHSHPVLVISWFQCQMLKAFPSAEVFEESESESELAGPKAAPLGRKQKQFKICPSSIMQGENYKIPLH